MGRYKEKRIANRDAKRQRKADVKLARIQSRENKAIGRQETRRYSIEHGIDPNAFIKDSISSVGKTVAGVVGLGVAGKTASNIFGKSNESVQAQEIREQEKRSKMSFLDKILDFFGLYKG